MTTTSSWRDRIAKPAAPRGATRPASNASHSASVGHNLGTVTELRVTAGVVPTAYLPFSQWMNRPLRQGMHLSAWPSDQPPLRRSPTVKTSTPSPYFGDSSGDLMARCQWLRRTAGCFAVENAR